MRHALPALVAAALVVLPAATRADQPGPPLPPPPNDAAFQIMEQAHTKVEAIHSQARLSILGALSPQHRTLLAQVVGQLAVAPNPDPAGAARLLDANLTPGEARTILNVSASAEQQTRQVMESAHQQLIKAMPAGTPPHGPWGTRAMYMRAPNDQWRTDPGMILLTMAMHSAQLGTFHQMSVGPIPVP